MAGTSPEAGDRGGTLVRKVASFAIVTLIVAALGAVAGWWFGSVAIGALFGALVGFWGCLRSGYALDEPNVVKPF